MILLKQYYLPITGKMLQNKDMTLVLVSRERISMWTDKWAKSEIYSSSHERGISENLWGSFFLSAILGRDKKCRGWDKTHQRVTFAILSSLLKTWSHQKGMIGDHFFPILMVRWTRCLIAGNPEERDWQFWFGQERGFFWERQVLYVLLERLHCFLAVLMTELEPLSRKKLFALS